MSEPKLRVLATCRAKADRLDEAKQVLQSLVGPSQAEEGCRLYVLQQNLEDPTDFAFVEEWEDAVALAKHAQTEHVQSARARLPELLEVPMNVRKYALVD